MPTWVARMLEARNVTASYGAAPAVSEVSLDVGEGDLVVVVGPNGAGKTTLINALAGLHRMDAGTLKVGGRDISRLPAHRFCDEGIALVPEGRRLFTGMTVRENLELGSYRSAAKSRRSESLQRITTLFPALREKLDLPAGTLSGGQQQMLAIGRALMARPRLLLLDEPSRGRAPTNVNSGGMAVLLVEQNVAMALQLARRAYVLEEGRIVAEGAPQELAAQPHIQRAYLGR